MELVGSSYGSIRPWAHSHCLPSWVLKSVKPHNRLLDNSRGEGRDRMEGSTGCLIGGICTSRTNHVVGIGATLLCNASKLSAQVRHVLLARWCKPRCRTRHMEEEAPVDPSLRLFPRSIMPGAHATWGEQSCVLFVYSEAGAVIVY